MLKSLEAPQTCTYRLCISSASERTGSCSKCIDNVVLAGNVKLVDSNQVGLHASQANYQMSLTREGRILSCRVLQRQRQDAPVGSENLVMMRGYVCIVNINDNKVILIHVLEQANLCLGVVLVRTMPRKMVVRDV